VKLARFGSIHAQTRSYRSPEGDRIASFHFSFVDCDCDYAVVSASRRRKIIKPTKPTPPTPSSAIVLGSATWVVPPDDVIETSSPSVTQKTNVGGAPAVPLNCMVALLTPSTKFTKFVLSLPTVQGPVSAIGGESDDTAKLFEPLLQLKIPYVALEVLKVNVKTAPLLNPGNVNTSSTSVGDSFVFVKVVVEIPLIVGPAPTVPKNTAVVVPLFDALLVPCMEFARRGTAAHRSTNTSANERREELIDLDLQLLGHKEDGALYCSPARPSSLILKRFFGTRRLGVLHLPERACVA
jgi:hypothetical protein